jgi:hypothetical protein
LVGTARTVEVQPGWGFWWHYHLWRASLWSGLLEVQLGRESLCVLSQWAFIPVPNKGEGE